jgi:aspartate/methionine/tyrosine aminotransferase
MSKTYGLAGLRIGWIATHQTELLRRIAALKDYTTICNSAPSEFLAEVALRHREQLAARNLQIIKNNISLLDEFFRTHAELFEWVRPKAGPIAFPRLLKGDIESFCDRLVKESGVLLLPGSLYDHPGNHFRIGYARQNMPDALEQLEHFLVGRSK